MKVHEVDAFTSVNAKLDSQAKRMDSMGVNSIQASCELCERSHPSKGCQNGSPFGQNDQANFVGSFLRQNDIFSNTYNPGWRNHPNFFWSNNQNAQKPPPNFQNQQLPTIPSSMPKKTSTEDYRCDDQDSEPR